MKKTVILLLAALVVVVLGLWLIPEEARTVLNIAGFVIAALVILAVVYVLFWVGKSRADSSDEKDSKKPEAVKERSRVVVTKSESSRSVSIGWGNIVIGILLAASILWLALGGWATVRDWFVSLGESQSLRDQKAIPGGRGFSAAVAIPQGYVICQYAELGDDSFTAEYQGLRGGEWLSLPGGVGGIASAIRWQSTSRPQVMYYLFVRPSEPCPRTW